MFQGLMSKQIETMMNMIYKNIPVLYIIIWWMRNMILDTMYWIGLDSICLTTTHVLKDILGVFHKQDFLNSLCSVNKLQSAVVLLRCGD